MEGKPETSLEVVALENPPRPVSRLLVAKFSSGGQNQETIRTALKSILVALSTDSDKVAAFTETINNDPNPTPTGVPAGIRITVNKNGAFFKMTNQFTQRLYPGENRFAGALLQAQATVLLHELGHIQGAPGFQGDANSPDAGRANDKLVDQHCGKSIKDLR